MYIYWVLEPCKCVQYPVAWGYCCIFISFQFFQFIFDLKFAHNKGYSNY